jgi:flagellar hook-associated protein 3 FlgL
MTITRVSTYGMHQATLGDVTRLQGRLAELQNQQSSGMRTNNFQGMDGQVEAFVQFEGKMRQTQTLVDNNTLIISRMQTTDVALEQIISIADDFQDLLIQRRNPVSGEALEFSSSARSMLKALGNQLNTAQEGRYLFGGSRTNVAPMPDEIPAPETPGIPDDLYYQGNDTDLFARVQQNFEVQYNVRANEPGFQKLVAAIHLGLQADAQGSQDLLQEATTMATEALDEIISIRSTVQQNIVNVEEINERHEQMNLYWKGLSEKMIKTDVLSVSTEIAMSTAILQASFSSFAQLNQLRLTDFLR